MCDTLPYLPSNVVSEILKNTAAISPQSAGVARTVCRQWLDARPLGEMLEDAFPSSQCLVRAVKGGSPEVFQHIIHRVGKDEIEFPTLLEPQELLNTAAELGHIHMCEMLMDIDTWDFIDDHLEKHGVVENVMMVDDMWAYPITEDAFVAAVRGDQLPAAKYLLPLVHDVYEEFYEELLYSACRWGLKRMCELIVEKMLYDRIMRPDIYNECMLISIYNRYRDIAEMFFDLGAKPLYRSNLALLYAVNNNDLAMVETLTDTSRFGRAAAKASVKRSSILTVAATHGFTEICMTLIARGADPNADHNNALNCAVFNNHCKTVEQLLNLGASADSIKLPSLDICALIHNKRCEST